MSDVLSKLTGIQALQVLERLAADGLFREWRERNADTAMRDTMDEFIGERCPEWAKNLVRADSRKQ